MFLKYSDRKRWLVKLDNFDYFELDSASRANADTARWYKRDWKTGDRDVYLINIRAMKVGSESVGNYVVSNGGMSLFTVGYQEDRYSKAAKEKAEALAQEVYDSLTKAMIAGEKVVELQYRSCFCEERSGTVFVKSV